MPDEAYREALKRIRRAKRENAGQLNLTQLGLETLPPELFDLKDIQALLLFSNNLTIIPEEIAGLKKLEQLSLSHNQITAIPEAIGNLLKLRELTLSANRIQVIPASLGYLPELRRLNLSSNQITAVPESLGHLSHLEILYLAHNRIMVIPKSLGNLTHLEEMYLHKNRITEVPDSLGNLSRLRIITLHRNDLGEMPESLVSLRGLKALFLQSNPRLGLPAEVLGSDFRDYESNTSSANPSEILEYYFRAKATGRPLNEAKLILVGRGGVGKTSLVNRLIDNHFDISEKKTEGIKIDRWKVEIDNEGVQLNVWDFGGQEIMHATHQFFLTERSLYLLVLNGREGGEDAETEYWLKLIGSFGANSPVIIVLNKISEHAFDLNRNSLLKKYPNIRYFVRTDCRDDIGIDELKAMILTETSRLEELRVRFPGEWFAVKDYLSTTDKNFLSFTEYRKVCSENGVPDIRHQEMLARYLNQLGIVLNYRDDPRLKHTHVLNPHWVTDGIYKILNSKRLEERHGVISLQDVSAILPEIDYPGETSRFIVDLMKRFDLCFSFPGDDSEYLIPELLPKNEPDEIAEFNLGNCLNFQYHYPILPEGLLPRFITRTHHLSEGEPRWRSGVILKFEDCRALVKADSVDKKIFISVTGERAENRRRLLAVIRADFERIHRDIKNLNAIEMVPLPGLPREIVPYRDLLIRESKGIAELSHVVGTDVVNYPIIKLLNGVDLSLPRRTKDREGLHLFFSYSHEDEAYRKELKTHLTILERSGVIQGWSDREIEVGDNWQAEIMENLNRADIILLLISSNFIASDFCYKIEMERALERHNSDEARVVPIILRDCIWETAPFAELQVLPESAKAVNTWTNRDTAWKSVAKGIEKAAAGLLIGGKKRQRRRPNL